MRRSPKLRPSAWDALVAGAVLALAVACGLLVWQPGTAADHLTAVVSVEGREVDRVDLTAAAGEVRTYSGGGYTLELELDAGGVRVLAADCPTQDCVHTGTITRSGQSIVCLPGRIIIQLTGGAAPEGAVDAVLG